MFKTFIFGIVLGAAAAMAAVWFLPVVDQARETSVIAVTPNGGNSESFHINVPMDRIIVGSASSNADTPPGFVWPEGELMGKTNADMYKLRNVHDAVIGVASRVVIQDEEIGNSIEWVLHLPARGSMYVRMETEVVPGSDRLGDLLSGTREFEAVQGAFSERWVADDSDEGLGRIELVSQYVASQEAYE